MLNDKLGTDPALRDVLISEYDKVDSNGDAFIDESEVKEALQFILKDQMKKFI